MRSKSHPHRRRKQALAMLGWAAVTFSTIAVVTASSNKSESRCYGKNFPSSGMCTGDTYIHITSAVYGLTPGCGGCRGYPCSCCSSPGDCTAPVTGTYYDTILDSCEGGRGCYNLKADWIAHKCTPFTDYVTLYYQCQSAFRSTAATTVKLQSTVSHTPLSTNATPGDSPTTTDVTHNGLWTQEPFTQHQVTGINLGNLSSTIHSPPPMMGLYVGLPVAVVLIIALVASVSIFARKRFHCKDRTGRTSGAAAEDQTNSTLPRIIETDQEAENNGDISRIEDVYLHTSPAAQNGAQPSTPHVYSNVDAANKANATYEPLRGVAMSASPVVYENSPTTVYEQLGIAADYEAI